jgi:hypothetical protein
MTRQGQNTKTVRHFQCRDYLWEIFEQMSAELECSTDYLINEAMRQYARSRNYGTNRSAQDADAAVTVPPHGPPPGIGAPGAIPSLREGSIRPALPTPPPPAPAQQVRHEAHAPPKAVVARPPTPPPMRAPSVPPPPPPGRGAPVGIQRPSVSAPPPLPGAPRMTAPASPRAQMPPLFVIFNGQRIPITKEEFVIGRSAKAADLPIKDGNISRRHAAVVFQDGAFFLKDLGSTNGVEFQGRNVDSKRIDEGDTFRLCDYEILFTYR